MNYEKCRRPQGGIHTAKVERLDQQSGPAKKPLSQEPVGRAKILTTRYTRLYDIWDGWGTTLTRLNLSVPNKLCAAGLSVQLSATLMQQGNSVSLNKDWYSFRLYC